MTDNDYLYSTWQKMMTRCYSVDYHSYHRYGGRGIIVCEEWKTWQGFKKSNPPGWKRGLTLDRINVDGNYCPENCRWLPKHLNTKTLLVEPAKLLAQYQAGLTQKQLAAAYKTDQPPH